MENRARGLLAIWREEEIAYVAGSLPKDIRNLKGKVDVFCFVYLWRGILDKNAI